MFGRKRRRKRLSDFSVNPRYNRGKKVRVGKRTHRVYGYHKDKQGLSDWDINPNL